MTCRVLLWLLVFNLFALQQAHGTWFNVDIREIDLEKARGLDFNRRAQFDLNNDGVKDIVKCSGKHWIQIIDGKTKRKLHSWSGPANKNAPNFNRYLAGCEIVKVGNRHAIFLANHSRWKSNSWLKTADQLVVYYDGSRFVRSLVNIEGFGKMRGAIRRVNCHTYPEKLVKLGYKPGALCFAADYAADYYNRSALLKLEFSGSRLIFKDISGSSGMPWKKGVRGTSIWGFRVGSGFSSNQRDGAFMMGSAFFDYDRDGIVDFVTVGQHASLRAHKIIADKSRAEGIRVSTSFIYKTSRNGLSELLNVKGFNNFDERVKIPCFYTSGEGHEGGLSSEGDRVYCYERGSWVRKNLPRVLSSQYANAQIRPVGGGRLYIKVENRRANNSIISRHLFDVGYTGETKHNFNPWTLKSKDMRASGYACIQNANRHMIVRSFSKPFWDGGKKRYSSVSATQTSGPWIQNQCMMPKATNKTYRFDIPNRSLASGTKKAIYTYAIDSLSDRRTLIGVSTYDKSKNGDLRNLKKLPLRNHGSLTVTWTNKGSNWIYSLDIIDQNGRKSAPCQHAGILKKNKSYTFKNGGLCRNKRKFNLGPSSMVRICGSPGSFSTPGTRCSPYQPVFGPRMHIKF